MVKQGNLCPYFGMWLENTLIDSFIKERFHNIFLQPTVRTIDTVRRTEKTEFLFYCYAVLPIRII